MASELGSYVKFLNFERPIALDDERPRKSFARKCVTNFEGEDVVVLLVVC